MAHLSQSGDAPAPVRWPVHHRGIKFDFAPGVGQASVPDAHIAGVIFEERHARDAGIEGVSAGGEARESEADDLEPVARRDGAWAATGQAQSARLGGTGDGPVSAHDLPLNHLAIACTVTARPMAPMLSVRGISLGQTLTQFWALPQSETPP